MKEWFVYICRCSDGTYYIGATIDVDKRIKTHNAGRGARYTKAKRPVQLLYSEKFPSKSEALKREYTIKQLSRKEKEDLIKKENNMVSMHPALLDKLKEAKKEFINQFGHLWVTQVTGGINGVGTGIADGDSTNIGISVNVESSQDVLDQIPDKFMGWPVHKRIVGKIVAL